MSGAKDVLGEARWTSLQQAAHNSKRTAADCLREAVDAWLRDLGRKAGVGDCICPGDPCPVHSEVMGYTHSGPKPSRDAGGEPWPSDDRGASITWDGSGIFQLELSEGKVITACGHSLVTCHTDRCFHPDAKLDTKWAAAKEHHQAFHKDVWDSCQVDMCAGARASRREEHLTDAERATVRATAVRMDAEASGHHHW